MASKKPKKKVVTLMDLGRELPSGGEIEAFLNDMEETHGRAAALSQSAFLETHLERAIAMHFYLQDDGHYAELFHRGGAPLGSFSGKITVAAALAILDPVQRKACDRIRAVRNVFAHAIKNIDFDTPEVARECQKLDPQSLMSADATWQGETNDARENFGVSALLISRHLSNYMRAMVGMRKAAGTWGASRSAEVSGEDEGVGAKSARGPYGDLTGKQSAD